MSLLNQLRIRITSTSILGDPWSEARLWTMSCPCCGAIYQAPSWREVLCRAVIHIQLDHCRYCIDGQMPAGRCPDMGELYERCPICQPICPDCDGLAVYPARFDSPDDLSRDLSTVGLGPIFCPDCLGVITLIALGHQEDLT